MRIAYVFFFYLCVCVPYICLFLCVVVFVIRDLGQIKFFIVYSDDFSYGTTLSTLHYEENEFLILNVSIRDEMDVGFKLIHNSNLKILLIVSFRFFSISPKSIFFCQMIAV